MKSIRGRILFWFLTTTLALLSILGLFVYFQTKNTVLPLTQDLALQVVDGNARMVSEWLSGRSFELKSTAMGLESMVAIKILQQKDVVAGTLYSIALQLSSRLKERKDVFDTYFVADYREGLLYETDGASVVSSSAKEREFYKKIIVEKQDSFVGELHVSELTKRPVFIIAHKVVDSFGDVVGVFGGTIPLENLTKLVSRIAMGEVGYGWIVDGTGLVLAHPERSMVGQFNVLKSSQAGYKGLEELGSKMVKGQQGFGTILAPDGKRLFLAFTPIPDTPNWTLGLAIAESELFARANRMIFMVVVVLLIIVVVIVLVSFIIGRSIARPIKSLAQSVQKFGSGDLTVEFSVKARDETSQMASALKDMAQSLRSSLSFAKSSASELDEFSGKLESVAKESERFATMLSEQADQLNKNVQNVSASMQQVGSGVEEVAASAQNVSKSAQQLSERSERVSKAAKEGEQAVEKIVEIVNFAKQMANSTVQTVGKLAEDAQNVAMVVETINAIAEQTNLLALNAAIEAARAGEAGRGFAVVADEIRKLAEQSKQATGSIDEILKKIQQGAKEADEKTSETAKVVDEAANQAAAVGGKLKDILSEVESMASMVESTAASAQEQSAAAEEMASAVDSATKAIADIAGRLEEMVKGVKRQAEFVQEIRQIGDELKRISRRLLESLESFKL
ncbi:MAG: Methyl-accepting chemotaxis sensory transducer [Thermotoga sp. 50_1627]|uniref:methyl-accepting chemotaxis protein n=1 Tax=Pseudothermotoga sp. TaxID=2033661 RepID=UPI00076D1D85|nr:MAG: Methyl-accepting chemotaxis sensory transducer [Thermotoga sp. 50_64]KUK25768.1 MAG: Methyl-accepting chemotaxis sensory transducer [Thermotoga sp. 50_1627]MBC7115452.1 methyl-accepting chemotaxis protein [Pseudothermotoga sp.]HBT40130.1 methyl-accepting chemotaxis protein [Pseudothermotoga sp.]HCO98837.1 methyl-accepting chemotaxis protein [Pseudothermotoga sp.]